MSAAIVTLIASDRLLPRYRWAVSAVAVIGFLLFAGGNHDALENMRRQRNAVIEFVKDKAKDTPQIVAVADASAPPSAVALRVYHWGLCVLVVLLLVALPAFEKPS